MDLTHPIIFGCLNALWILGVFTSAEPGQILGAPAEWMAGNASKGKPRRVPEWITKPLFDCPYCQSSFHGILWWLIFRPFPLQLLPFYVVCLCGLMKLIATTGVADDNQ
jgi:hypothetical protein